MRVRSRFDIREFRNFWENALCAEPTNILNYIEVNCRYGEFKAATEIITLLFNKRKRVLEYEFHCGYNGSVICEVVYLKPSNKHSQPTKGSSCNSIW